MADTEKEQHTETRDTPRLSLETPIDAEGMRLLTTLDEARVDLALRLLDLELDKLTLLGAGRRIDSERTQLFNSFLTARGVAAGTSAKVNRQGFITLVDTAADEAPEESEVEEAEAPSE